MDHERTRWFKSSYSGGSGTECIEVADLMTAIGVRDSKRPNGRHIAVQRDAWAGFIASVRLQQL
ncbi:DUF397 domain-containing protein [Streptomyces sp. NBC_01618]|uniref:DUF397 domain-containing protein n=1 Tax=Streptomyces sp. NBC_01618 TaxID=2975900 RepID=UPI00386A1535|nr:DUF397 domain-containing protein [Streptomyces sp. NBC_01618]